MRKQKTIFAASGALAILAIIAGGLLVVAYGFEPPAWLLCAEVAAFSGLALICGFTAAGTSLLPWLTLRPVQGALPGLTHHNSETGSYGKVHILSKPRLLPFSF